MAKKKDRVSKLIEVRRWIHISEGGEERRLILVQPDGEATVNATPQQDVDDGFQKVHASWEELLIYMWKKFPTKKGWFWRFDDPPPV